MNYVRDAQRTDISKIRSIYSYYVAHSIATLEEAIPSVEEITKRFDQILERSLPYLVFEQEGDILGYAYAHPFNTRCAYRFTVENTVYVKHNHAGFGCGSKLMHELITRLKNLGMNSIVTQISNPLSVEFHKKLGFRKVGTLNHVGFKFDRWIDTILMQLEL